MESNEKGLLSVLGIQQLFFILLITILGLLMWGVFNSYSLLGWNNTKSERFWLELGNQAMVLSFVALALFLIRKVRNKLTNTDNTSWLNKMIVFLIRYHRAIAGAAVMLAMGHGIYFLSYLPMNMGTLYTGLATLVSMIIVVGLGLTLQYKKINFKAARKWHIYSSMVFVFLLLLVHN